jgi:hypothetical protein
MRNLLILCLVGILSAVAWTLTASEGASRHGSMHAPVGHGGSEGRLRLGRVHPADMGIFFPIEPAQQFMDQLPGEPGPAPAHLFAPTGGLVAGEPEHNWPPVIAGGPEHNWPPVMAGAVVDAGIRPLEHMAPSVERGDAENPHPNAPGAADLDHAGTATLDHAGAATLHHAGAATLDHAGSVTAQPNPPAASPLPRPPGAPGPGRRVYRWSGPGLPGPGRRQSPQP